MPSTFLGLNISYTGLVAANAGLNVTANNIANIETKGYTRQQVNQVAADAIKVNQSYGMVGAGVDTLCSERVRDLYFDKKFWNNNSKVGEFDKKQYYNSLIENYLQDTKGSNAVTGFTTIFDDMDDAMKSLATHTGDPSYASTFIGKAGNLCEYFNLIYNNFQQMQVDVNDEIKICIDQINSKASEIATLNKEINIIERDGTAIANELRDKRDLIIDELSKMIDVDTEEQDVYDERTKSKTGAKNYVVKIAGGQTLVNGYDYRELKCVARESYQKVNENDAEGLYDVIWTDTNEQMGVYANTTQGQIKGLFQVRDGNNGEAFNGVVRKIDAQNQRVTIEVTDDYLKDMSKSTLPLFDGCITVAGDKYIYDSFDFELKADGTCYYTFNLSTNEAKNPEPIDTSKASQKAKIGEKVDFQGIAYYLEQMNEWVRDYACAFNDIYGQDQATDYNEQNHNGDIFFTGTNKVDGSQFKMEVPFNKNRGDGYATLMPTQYNSLQEGYFRITAGNFNVEKSLEDDPSSMVTHTGGTTGKDGVSKYDIVEELIDLSVNKDILAFRGCKVEDFLVCLMGDAALNAESANNFQGIYEDILNTIENNRISISGVDADEEAANLLTYQNAYKLSSKMISVLAEIYDRLILQTGV